MQTAHDRGIVHRDAELHRHGEVPALGGSFSPALDRMFQRALAKRPADRWGTALELAGALRAASGIGTSRSDLPRIDQDVRLWRGEVLADLERWMRQAAGAAALGDLEAAFVSASGRAGRHARWIWRLLVAVVVATAFGVVVNHFLLAKTTTMLEKYKQSVHRLIGFRAP